MSPRRRQVVAWFIGLLLGMHAIVIVCKRDDWPFSCYPMFSGVQGSRYRLTTLYGVSPDGRESLLHESQFWAPMSMTQVQAALRLSAKRDRKSRKKDLAAANRSEQVVGGLFELYERNRASGRHRGPQLIALRLYYTTWDLDPHLRNLDTPVAQELFHEVVASPLVDR